MVRLLVHSGFSEIEIERTRSPTPSRSELESCRKSNPPRKARLSMNHQVDPRIQQCSNKQATIINPHIDAPTDTFPKEIHNKKDQNRRKEWKSIFRRRRSPVEKIKDDFPDTRDDSPSPVNDEHSDEKVPLWGWHWKKSKKKNMDIRPIQSKQRSSDLEKKLIKYGSAMQRTETDSLQTTSGGETTRNEPAEESQPNQPGILLDNVPTEDYNCPLREEGLEQILSDESSFSLTLSCPTKIEDSSKRIELRSLSSDKMDEARRKDSVLAHVLFSAEQPVESREESLLPQQYSDDREYQQKETFLESDSKENCAEERDSQNMRELATSESREETYFVPTGIFGLPSCYRDTTALPLHIPSRRAGLSNTFHQRNDSGETSILEAQNSYQHDRTPNYQGVKTRKRGVLMLPSCTRGTASLPLILSSEEDYSVQEKVKLPGTARRNKSENGHTFGAPSSITVTAHIDDEESLYRCFHKKSGIDALPNQHEEASSSSLLPSLETAIHANIALSNNSNERLSMDQHHRVHGIPVQNSTKKDERPSYQGRSFLALLTCHNDTTSHPWEHSVVASESLKSKEKLDSLRCLSWEKKDKLRNRVEKPILQTVLPPTSMGDLLRRNWSELNSDLVVPKHNLLSFSSFSNTSGDAPTQPQKLDAQRNFVRGLDCIAYGGTATPEYFQSFTEEGDSYSSLSDPGSFADAFLGSSKSMGISEFVEMAEMDMNDVYSDLSSFSSSYASSSAISRETISSSDEHQVEIDIAGNDGGVHSVSILQIAKELQLDPAELLRRLKTAGSSRISSVTNS